MSKISHLKSRVLFFALMAGVGIGSVLDGVSTQSLGNVITGSGLILFGVYSFLVPPNLRSSMSMSASAVREKLEFAKANALGSVKLRTSLMIVGFSLMMLGIFLRFALKV